MSVYKSTENELDPLDREFLERAFDATWEAIKGSHQHFDADSDEALEGEPNAATRFEMGLITFPKQCHRLRLRG